mmetsp:Transcript_15587/g.39832  ORF Transcript_15587/g.39832 Transcript_15587/m.39832 type:complete len:266 (+) Transcript_15587:735-1532(+)
MATTPQTLVGPLWSRIAGTIDHIRVSGPPLATEIVFVATEMTIGRIRATIAMNVIQTALGIGGTVPESRTGAIEMYAMSATPPTVRSANIAMSAGVATIEGVAMVNTTDLVTNAMVNTTGTAETLMDAKRLTNVMDHSHLPSDPRAPWTSMLCVLATRNSQAQVMPSPLSRVRNNKRPTERPWLFCENLHLRPTHNLRGGERADSSRERERESQTAADQSDASTATRHVAPLLVMPSGISPRKSDFHMSNAHLRHENTSRMATAG